MYVLNGPQPSSGELCRATRMDMQENDELPIWLEPGVKSWKALSQIVHVCRHCDNIPSTKALMDLCSHS